MRATFIWQRGQVTCRPPASEWVWAGWLLRHTPTACLDGFAKKVLNTSVLLPLSPCFSLGLTPLSPVSPSLIHSHQLLTLITWLPATARPGTCSKRGRTCGPGPLGSSSAAAPLPWGLGLALVYSFIPPRVYTFHIS